MYKKERGRSPSTSLDQNIPYTVALQQSDDMLVLALLTSVKNVFDLQTPKNKQPTFCPLETMFSEIAYFLSITPELMRNDRFRNKKSPVLYQTHLLYSPNFI